MLQKFKNLLKRFWPASARTFHQALKQLLGEINRNRKSNIQEIRRLEQALVERIEAVSRENAALQGFAGELEQTLVERIETVSRENAALQGVAGELEQTLVERIEALSQENTAVKAVIGELGQMLVSHTEALSQENTDLRAAVEELKNELGIQKEAILSAQGQDAQTRKQEQRALLEAIEKTRRQALESVRYASEAVWAEIFNNTIVNSAWLQDKTFSPGRWAVGYPALYVIYRVLNEARPKRVLELGLGQSTRMIGQYAAVNQDVEHIVVEHDPEWIAFFQNDFALSERTKILQLEREMVPYQEAEAVRTFRGFREALAGQKFDFIFIDAPLGGDMKQYARIDVLRMLPDCLSSDFVIMIDDCERPGETHTLAEMENRLTESGVVYKRGRYSGKKDCVLMSAEHMGFLTSL